MHQPLSFSIWNFSNHPPQKCCEIKHQHTQAHSFGLGLFNIHAHTGRSTYCSWCCCCSDLKIWVHITHHLLLGLTQTLIRIIYVDTVPRRFIIIGNTYKFELVWSFKPRAFVLELTTDNFRSILDDRVISEFELLGWKPPSICFFSVSCYRLNVRPRAYFLKLTTWPQANHHPVMLQCICNELSIKQQLTHANN